MNKVQQDPIKRAVEYQKCVQVIRHKTKLFSTQPVKSSELPRTALQLQSKLNTFNSRRTSPLPPISLSADSHFENYLSISIDGCFKNNVYLKKSKKIFNRPTQSVNFSLDPIVKKEKIFKKSKGSLGKGKKSIEGSEKVKENRIEIEKNEEKKKVDERESKECDVQTNELDYDFHLIYEDEGRVDQLALNQLKLIHFYENVKKSKPPI